MSASASLDDHGPDEGQAPGMIKNLAPDDAIVVDDALVETIDSAISNDTILDVTGDVPFVEPSPVADEVLDGFRDPVMPLVIFGMVSFILIVALAAMLAL